ncbi:MAG: MFS transporter [Anaerolineaceae bacterium]
MTTIKVLIKNRSLVIIGISESVSNIGNWITMMAVLALVLFRGGGGVKESSLIMLAGLLPTLLFSPVAGWLCDHFDRKKLMIISELISGVLIAGLIFVTRLEWILVILALEAASLAIMGPARQSVVPSLVAPEDLTKANAFFQQLSGIIKIGAPMLAGLVLAVMNPHQAIILDVVSFALSALILSRLPSLKPHKAIPSDKQDKAEESGEGVLPVLKRLPLLRLLFVALFITIFVIIGFDTLAPIYFRDVLSQTEQFFGLSIGLVGLGTVGVSFMLMSRKTNSDPGKDKISRLMLLATIPTGLALGTLIHVDWIMSLIVAFVCLIGGIGVGLINIQAGTLLQTLSPAAVLGRMSGLFQGTAVMGQLFGILIIPLVVPGVLTMGPFFAIGAVVIMVVAVVTMINLRGKIQAVEVGA